MTCCDGPVFHKGFNAPSHTRCGGISHEIWFTGCIRACQTGFYRFQNPDVLIHNLIIAFCVAVGNEFTVERKIPHDPGKIMGAVIRLRRDGMEENQITRWMPDRPRHRRR